MRARADVKEYLPIIYEVSRRCLLENKSYKRIAREECEKFLAKRCIVAVPENTKN